MEVEVYTCGALAADAYNPISLAHEEVQKLLKPSEKYLYAKGLRVLHEYQPLDTKDGFFARCYGNIYTRETAIAFRGTIPNLENITADFLLWWGRESGMLKKAELFYSNAWDVITGALGTDREGKPLKTYGQFQKSPTLTGHSLGGYLAQYIGTNGQPLQTVVFNAPKIGDLRLASGKRYIDPSKDYSHILNIDIDYDEVHTVGTRIGRQHLLHGDAICSPESYELYLQHKWYEPSRIYTGNMLYAVNHKARCVSDEHYMANVMAKMASETHRQLEQEGYAASLTANETMAVQGAS